MLAQQLERARVEVERFLDPTDLAHRDADLDREGQGLNVVGWVRILPERQGVFA